MSGGLDNDIFNIPGESGALVKDASIPYANKETQH